MASLDLLEAEIDEIKKQLSYLTKASNSGTSTGGETGESQPSQNEDWITLYDCSSEDANINLGYASGIKGGTGTIEIFPDLMTYKYLKVYFQASNDYGIFEYDISDTSTSNSYQIFFPTRQLTVYICMNFIVDIRNEKRTIHFGSCKQVAFYTNKYPAFTDLKTSEYFYIKKIMAK